MKKLGWILSTGVMVLTGFSGLIWVINLPYPMIRKPIAAKAPILLLPSYISMDKNYREAIAHVEQSDQLVNQATSEADIELGTQKVILAQKNLDALPVWFLGYEPKMYCSLMGCSWHFTLDEYKAARMKVGRMEAVIFQENNALEQLEEIEATLTQAKQEYEQAQTTEEKNRAIALWQQGIDSLNLIPRETLAGNMAKTKLVAYQRDFQAVSGLASGSNRTIILVSAAQEFAKAANKMSANPPHSVTKWQQCASLWQQAIKKLEGIPLEDPGYLEAQSLLASYKIKLGEVQIKREAEANGVRALEEAERKIEILLASLPVDSQSMDRNRVISQLQGIINELDKVEPGTTVYEKAQELLNSAREKLNQLQP